MPEYNKKANRQVNVKLNQVIVKINKVEQITSIFNQK